MPDPVVGRDDNPPGSAGSNLPPELQGRTPEQIAEYYADRERTILDNATRMVNEAQASASRNPNAPPEPKPVPSNATPVTRQEFDQVTQYAREGLINMAQMTARQGKDDWDKLLPEVKKILASCPPEQQINAHVWEEAYYNVRGHITDTLISEARNRALGLESAPPPTPPPPKPRQLTDAELKVCDGCGITQDMYIKAEERLDTGYQPFTVDNRRQRVGAQ